MARLSESSAPILMDASGADLLTVSDLLRQSRPQCGTSNLSSSTSRRAPESNSLKEPTRENPSPTAKILTPIDRPVVLVGTVTLPVFDFHADSSTPHKCPSSNSACFRFSDGTSTVCCDVLNFGMSMLNEKILVLAFNFIPFKHGGGFLEIVKWSFPLFCDGGLRPCSSVVSFPLTSGVISAFEDGAKAFYDIRGAVESVSPVFTRPFSTGTKSNANLRGFLVEFMICDCQLYKSKGLVKELVNSLAESHSCSKPVLVYFCGSSSHWHPAITKLIGSVVVLSGLKKKMIIEKEESHIIFVVTEKSLLHLLRVPRKSLPHAKTRIRGRGECGHYSGTVRAVYSQGMVVELDEEVWLLLTDEQLVLPHSIRIGAIIAVKNAHFVRAKFSFREVLILGCCLKSSILVESFSPLVTGCYVMSQMQSLLADFIASLTFSARMWMLLAVSSFCKKFAGILTEKEILGSKVREGLSQLYAGSCLPSWAIQQRHGVLWEMCKHASASSRCCSEPHDRELKLVVPLSSFMLHCEGLWSRVLHRRGIAFPESYKTNQNNCLPSEGTCSQSVRRIIPSQEIGVKLFGTLKISPASGRLQLFDATGSIDVLVPDLPSTWKPSSIYEVSEYSLIIEGIPQRALDHPKERLYDSFSCKRIFNCSTLQRELNVNIVIYFHFRNATCRDLSFGSFDVPKDEHEELNGEFHMLQVVHKFPVLQKFSGGLAISERSSAFVEALIWPWGLYLSGKDGGEHCSEAVKNNSNNSSQVSRKRQKTDRSLCNPSSGSQDDVSNLASDRSGFLISSWDSHISGLIDMNSHKIPCLASVRNSNKTELVSSGMLYRMDKKAKTDSGCKPSISRILMEFKSSDLFQYQGLQIGGYYIVKHQRKCSLCTFLGSDHATVLKTLITSKTKLWRFSIISSDNLIDNGSSCGAPSSKFRFLTNNLFVEDEMRYPAKASASYSSMTSDIYLQACRDLLGPLELDLKEIQCHFINLATTKDEVNLSSCNGTGVSLLLSFKAPGFEFSFPNGKLTCIHGEVTSVHILKSHGSLVDSDWSRNFHGNTSSVSIHVMMGNRTVEIFGSLRKHACPIGFGQGVNATFYRILKLSVQNRFMLTPISFIEIDSLRVVNDVYLPHHADACSTSEDFVASNVVSSGLISELVLSSGCNLIHLRCRVVDVRTLIFERDGRSDSLKSKLKSMAPHRFDIPIAAFVLEDGSSSCVCWANGEQASTFLRLSEKLPETALGSTYGTFKWVGAGNKTCGSSGYYLEKILKKHKKITMKNYGSLSDSCEDLSFSVGPENVLSNSDENLLKSVVVNASFGRDWAIVGNIMDLAAVRQLQEQHSLQTDMELDSFQHLWAREVHCSDPLKEARRIIEELRTGN